ncbi:shikimate dehydrogenase [Pseudolabrys sp. FHR47]|uniref:shikimate dehydrogenase family protein n=1 Tax=Pseudolabrys sp. FHR47 TaxID=2562284 RepID=UPI0010BF62E5|nr:shikimate dehydrogenase [Pseudolabrys sp. FHR47]
MTSSPIKLGLIGDNIAASSSPALHRIAGRLVGLSVTYDLLRPADRGASFEAVLASAETAGYRGVNITYPYKERVNAYIDVPDPAVRAIGACNTVLFGAKRPVGWNTDYSGFMAAYRHHFGQRPPGRVAMAGTGGVGRAIAFALCQLGASELRLFDIDAAKSSALAQALRALPSATTVTTAATIEEAAKDAEGLVNSTPIGMVGIGGCPFPEATIAGRRWAFDAVYTPVDTPFMVAAGAAGLDLLSGYELFFYQGVDAFRHFTGKDVPELPLRDALKIGEEKALA